MRVFHRAVATAVAGLAFAAAGVIGAAPASATPEDGKGCVGTPAIAVTYVCVISVTPETVVPATTVTNVPVVIPSLCYFLDCTGAKTVDVPVPGVSPRSGVVAVLWHQGKYIPIAVGPVDALGTVYSTINLATGIANGAVTTAGQTVSYAATVANGAAATAVGIATSTAGTVLTLADTYGDLALSTAAWALTYGGATADYAVAYAGQTVANARQTVDNEVAAIEAQVDAIKAGVQEIVNGLPTAQEIRDALVDWIRETIYPYQDVPDNLIAWIQDCIRYSCQVA